MDEKLPNLRLTYLLLFLILAFSQCKTAEPESNFFGNWAFNLPDGNPAWLSIQEDSTARLLWSVGSPHPIDIRFYEKNRFELSGELSWNPFGKTDVYEIINPINGVLNENGNMVLSVNQVSENKEEGFQIEGKKIPPIPAKPDLSKLNFGEKVDLLANELNDWKLNNPDKINGWSFTNNTLVNETPKTDFGAYGAYGNLQTIEDFEDFELNIDYNVPEGGNSGIYLRGAYEVQVVDRDSRMQGVIGPGSVFGRIKPEFNNAKPGGEWNNFRILLVNRHITVELNGEKIIDNQPLEGCTGGGMNADDTKPGPILLQGDHTAVKYRNICIREVTTKK